MAQDKSIPKAYDASGVEDAIYSAWEKSGYFTPENLPNLADRTESYTIVLPPPNRTGTLHIGHAVMLAIEDALVRFHRMNGKRALWLPGTDHAAIATQTKVEKLLMKEGMKDPRHELGREKFLERVTQFAQESHDTIVNQMKKMGTSVDWTREAYTLDETRHQAVNTAFKRMHEDGLIYQGFKVVNWCPRCQSTLADDEVEHKEGTAQLFTFRYDKNFPISISTTRPETKLGDTAVAVNPDDKRYKDFIGQTFEVEFAGGPLKIQVIADPQVDSEYGTGALGVTPAHSKIDEEMAQKNDLPFIEVISEDGKMTDRSGMAGLTTLEARDKVVDWLKSHKLLESEEAAPQNLSICYRCSSPIEPLPKKQWFIDVNKEFKYRQSERHPIKGLKDGQKATLKQLMQHVVRKGEIEILPDRFNKTYFHWIDNLRDWNISRQIWFGHRVPVWYKGNEIAVVDEPKGEGWEQDPDTLDTWFSSGLWTFSTLGWPEQTEDLKTYHPTQVLETGYDILFFWVARMILMTTYLIGEIPFEKVYLHGLVRDEQGRKMSKSLDNALDPLDTIANYGADATRLALMIGSTPGNDTRLSEEKIAAYRNFTNKLWNISRFTFMSVDRVESVKKAKPETLADRWVLGRLSEVTEQVTEHFENYELSMLGEVLRDFTWNEFADWYLEIAKIQDNENTHKILLYVLERLLKLWHPFMPFVTEEIYKQFDADMIIVAKWPQPEHKLDQKDGKAFAQLQEIISAIRNIRAEYKVDYKKAIQLAVSNKAWSEEQVEMVKKLARVEEIEFAVKKKPEQAASALVGKTQLYVPLADLIDLDQEKARLKKELAEAERYVGSLESKLNNDAFSKNAPKDVVAAEKGRLQEAQERVGQLKQELSSLS